jgi:hypothetical protein
LEEADGRVGEGEEVTTFQEIWWLAFGNSCAEHRLCWRTPHHGGRLARERRGANAAGNQTSTRPDLDLLARSTAGCIMPSKLLAVHAVTIPISRPCRLFRCANQQHVTEMTATVQDRKMRFERSVQSA